MFSAEEPDSIPPLKPQGIYGFGDFREEAFEAGIFDCATAGCSLRWSERVLVDRAAFDGI